MEKILHTIAPVYDENSRILILGSMPSPKSREAGFYYAHPQNRFWKILESVFNEKIGTERSSKIAFLLKNHIALWDVLHSCEIEGASDASIRCAEINNFSPIFERAHIHAVFLTGSAAYNYFTRNVKCSLPLIRLPSPSSANAAWSLDRLCNEYKILTEYI